MSPEQPIIERVKKLLALSKSSNVAEAELALARANELIQKWNINIIEHLDETTNKWTFQVHDNNGKSSVFYGNRLQEWEHLLMKKLAIYCDGKIVKYGYSNTTRYCFVGLESDAAMIKLLFWDINERTRKIFKNMKKDLGIKDLNSFALGVVVVLCERMIEAKKVMLQSQVSERGLVTIDHKNAAFTDYYKELSKNFTTYTNSYNKELNYTSFLTGKKVGQDMEMSVVNPTV